MKSKSASAAVSNSSFILYSDPAAWSLKSSVYERTWYLADDAVPVINSPALKSPVFIVICNSLVVSFQLCTKASVPESDPTTLSFKWYVPIPIARGELTVTVGMPSYPEPALVKNMLERTEFCIIPTAVACTWPVLIPTVPVVPIPTSDGCCIVIIGGET